MAEIAARIQAVGITHRLLRGVIGGIVAGIVFAGITMVFTAVTGPGPWAAPRMIATIALGQEGFAPTFAAGPVALGLGIHMMLSVAYGAFFALVVPAFRTTAAILLGGTAYGLLLYLANFQTISPMAFPIFGMANQAFEVLAHALFGLVLGVFFLSRQR